MIVVLALGFFLALALGLGLGLGLGLSKAEAASEGSDTNATSTSDTPTSDTPTSDTSTSDTSTSDTSASDTSTSTSASGGNPVSYSQCTASSSTDTLTSLKAGCAVYGSSTSCAASGGDAFTCALEIMTGFCETDAMTSAQGATASPLGLFSILRDQCVCNGQLDPTTFAFLGTPPTEAGDSDGDMLRYGCYAIELILGLGTLATEQGLSRDYYYYNTKEVIPGSEAARRVSGGDVSAEEMIWGLTCGTRQPGFVNYREFLDSSADEATEANAANVLAFVAVGCPSVLDSENLKCCDDEKCRYFDAPGHDADPMSAAATADAVGNCLPGGTISSTRRRLSDRLTHQHVLNGPQGQIVRRHMKVAVHFRVLTELADKYSTVGLLCDGIKRVQAHLISGCAPVPKNSTAATSAQNRFAATTEDCPFDQFMTHEWAPDVVLRVLSVVSKSAAYLGLLSKDATALLANVAD